MTRANNVMLDELKWTLCCYGHDVLSHMTKLFMTSYVHMKSN
jgi:hypothetical protein